MTQRNLQRTLKLAFAILEEQSDTISLLAAAVQELRYASGGPRATGPFGSGGDGIGLSSRGIISGATINELVVSRLKVTNRLKIPKGTDKFGSTNTLRESFTTVTGPIAASFGADWNAQGFTPLATYRLVNVILKVYRLGSPGTVTVGIRNNNGNSPEFGGSDIATGTFDGNALGTDTAGTEQTITMITPVELTQGTVYHIAIRATAGDSSNYVGWVGDIAAGYPDGNRSVSDDSGATWISFVGHDFYFKINSQEILEANVWIEGDDFHFFDESDVEHAIPLDVISKAFLDAKGDLITASANNTPAILTAGANGDMLVPNSDAAGGLEWVSVVTYEDSVVVHEGETVHV